MTAQLEMVITDWTRVAAEFHADRDVAQTRSLIDASTIDLEGFKRVAQCLNGWLQVDRAQLARELDALWQQAAAQKGSTFVLAYALYCEVQHAWELSAETDNMISVIASARQTWDAAIPLRATIDPAETTLAQITISHLDDLQPAFGMENGLNCSCPAETADCAAAVATSSARLLQQLPDVPIAWRGQADVLRSTLAAHAAYFEGVHSAADCILQHVLGTMDRDGVDRRYRELDAVRHSPELKRDVYASELRAHVVALRSLVDRLDTSSLGELSFPDLEVTYLFPFTTRGSTDDLHHDNVMTLEALKRRRQALLHRRGITPREVVQHDLSDIWTHGRAAVFSEGPLPPTAYEVVSVQFGDTWVQPKAGEPIGPLRTEVRFSSFGNHHVRIWGRVQSPDTDRPPGYHELNQAIRRGSSFMGTETVTMEGLDEEFTSMAELARRLVADISAWDQTLGIESLRCHFDAAVDGHALVTMPQAVIRCGEAQRDATGEEILEAVGPLLMIPVERTAAGLEEWLRYEEPAHDTRAPNFLGDLAPVHSLAVQTPRSTCLYTPGMPDWSMLGTSELVEFIVSSRALLRQWNRHLQAAIANANTMLAGRLSGTNLRDRPMRELRLRLAGQAALVRQQRALLHSEELARSPGHRQILDNLLDSSQAEQLESEVDVAIAELDALYSQLGDDASAVVAERTAHYQELVGLMLYLLALFSLADLFSFGNDLVYSGDPPSAVAVVELVLYAIAVVGLALWGWVAYRRSRG